MSKPIRHQNLFVLGFGGVGRALIRHIIATRSVHAARRGLRLEVVGLADSRGAAVAPSGFDDGQLARLTEQKQAGLPLAEDPFPISNLQSLLSPGSILVDTTATDATVPLLLGALRNGCGLVLANKLPLAGDQAWYDEIAAGPSRWETTVGAALPVIATLNALLDSGDEVIRIEGSLSGTLGFIASRLETGVPFGDAVREARQLGYTEPDPRQDLGGRDAGRKALILARMLGYRLDLEDVYIESLYPSDMDALSLDEFLQQVNRLNQAMAARAAELCRGGRTLRYAAVVGDGRCRVELTGVDLASKLGGIRSSDSVAVFTTHRYRDNPLSVSGRGAGQEVTAGGVLADIVNLALSMAS